LTVARESLKRHLRIVSSNPDPQDRPLLWELHGWCKACSAEGHGLASLDDQGRCGSCGQGWTAEEDAKAMLEGATE